jgi:N-methylhydantoinase A
MPVDVQAARAVFAPVAERLGFTTERAAHGVLGIVVSNMVRAIRAISVERGHDPRQFALMPFGGAGPLHAGDVARSLGMRQIIVPDAPGILCARGLVVSDLQEDFVRTARTPVDAKHIDPISDHIDALMRTADAWCDGERLTAARRSLQVRLDMRYVGQNFELSVPLDDTLLTGLQHPEAPTRLCNLFFAAHEQQYGYHNPNDTVEIINYRLTVRGQRHQPSASVSDTSNATGRPTPLDTRSVYFTADTPIITPVFDRTTLLPGHSMTGPAVIEQLDATTLIYPGDTLRVDPAGNLLIEVQA